MVLAINMERLAPAWTWSMSSAIGMVQMADVAASRSPGPPSDALEMTIAPNPFQILTWWAAQFLGGGRGRLPSVEAYDSAERLI